MCDELDGRFARMLNQCSTLGSVLDMVTDRVATSCLLAVLCVLYPRLLLPLLALLMLDIFSHWFQMYSTLAMGSASHKVRLCLWAAAQQRRQQQQRQQREQLLASARNSS